MARSFRIFGKKRGHRRTGSSALGSAGEALFFAFLLTVGGVFLALLLARTVIPEWRTNHEFTPHQAQVLNTRVSESTDSDGHPVFRPEVFIAYRANGVDFSTWTYDISTINALRSAGKDDRWTYDISRTQFRNEVEAKALLERFEKDANVTCWYDPLEPQTVVLVRGYSWWFWVLLLVPLGFLLIGGGGLVYTLWHWGKSPERRAARGHFGRIDLLEALSPSAKDFPTVPHDADLINSPGTHLKYRLPTNSSPGWRLFAATVVCLCWNGIVAVFLVVAVSGHWRGQPDWWFDLFVAPFALAGGFLIYYFVRELLIATGVGPTLIEISDHPLWPGKTYGLYLSQGGHLSMKSFDVTLECHEQATYRQGTDTRTDRRLVQQYSLLHRDEFEILPNESFEAHCDLPVPHSAMHSFQADHNQVQWTLVVRGCAEGWPGFERRFPVVVYPPMRTAAPEETETDQQVRELAV